MAPYSYTAVYSIHFSKILRLFCVDYSLFSIQSELFILSHNNDFSRIYQNAGDIHKVFNVHIFNSSCLNIILFSPCVNVASLFTEAFNVWCTWMDVQENLSEIFETPFPLWYPQRAQVARDELYSNIHGYWYAFVASHFSHPFICYCLQFAYASKHWRFQSLSAYFMFYFSNVAVQWVCNECIE